MLFAGVLEAAAKRLDRLLGAAPVHAFALQMMVGVVGRGGLLTDLALCASVNAGESLLCQVTCCGRATSEKVLSAAEAAHSAHCQAWSVANGRSRLPQSLGPLLLPGLELAILWAHMS